MKMINRLWSDEAGFVVSSELILVGTIAVIGLITGMAAIRDSVVAELSDFGGAINNLDQSFEVFGISGHAAATEGYDYVDLTDFCDDNDDLVVGQMDNCITIVDTGAYAEGTIENTPTGP